jgi:hypothetical protein
LIRQSWRPAAHAFRNFQGFFMTNSAITRAQPRSAAKLSRDQIARLKVTTDICPQVFSRVMGLFAQRDILPIAMCFERRARSLRFEIAVASLDTQHIGPLAAKVVELVRVRSARWVEADQAAAISAQSEARSPDKVRGK